MQNDKKNWKLLPSLESDSDHTISHNNRAPVSTSIEMWGGGKESHEEFGGVLRPGVEELVVEWGVGRGA